jgi:hypothetical protein
MCVPESPINVAGTDADPLVNPKETKQITAVELLNEAKALLDN